MQAAPQLDPVVENRPPWLTWTLLAGGVMAASLSGIFIRYASKEHLGDAGPLAISFWRCAVGAAVLLPFALRGLRQMRPQEFLLPAVAGAFLAVHFATWITSIDLTTIAASVLLVSTTPVFTAGLGWFVFHERMSGRGWAGIALALAGTALVVGTDLTGSSGTGNALALAGGATVAGYVMAGRAARRTLGILPYAVIAYLVSAVLLLPAVLVTGQPLGGYGRATWIALAAIVAGPQLLGHTIINLVLKEIDATTVSVAVMAEPVLATIAAYLLFAETPSALIYPGGVAILTGIYLVSTIVRPAVVVE